MRIRHRVLFAIIILTLWQVVSQLLNKDYLPSPLALMVYLVNNPNEIYILFIHSFFSLERIFISFVISLLLSMIFGYVMGCNPHIDKFLFPLINLFHPIPKIAVLPIILLFFGSGELSKNILLSSVIFFQIVIPIRDSTKNIISHQKYIELGKLMYGNAYTIFIYIVLPGTLTAILTALKLAIGTSLAVLFFVESYATKEGLGYYVIMQSWGKMNYYTMFLGITTISFIGFILFSLIEIFERNYMNRFSTKPKIH